MRYSKQLSLNRTFYSELLLNNIYLTASKQTKCFFSYAFFLKKVYFVTFVGICLKNNKKNYKLNQTVTLKVKVKRRRHIFTLPVQCNMVSVSD